MHKQFSSTSNLVNKLFLTLQVIWLLTITGSGVVNHYTSHRWYQQTVLAEAQAIVKRDLAFRRWFAENGGTYVKVSRRVQPNPHLSHIPDRDIKMPDGVPLTLVNPAYMMRLINESITDQDSPLTHMTSTRPLRPENQPDPWEAVALQRAAAGEPQIYEFTTHNGQATLRYLHPSRVEAPCLKCHASQGYQLGDLRGGLVLNLPIGRMLAAHEESIRFLYLGHLLIYLLGLAFMLGGQRFIAVKLRERALTLAALAASEENFRTVANFAHAWEYWLAPDGHLKHVSPSVARITGYPAERFLSDPEFIKSILVGDNRELLHQHLEEDQRQSESEMDFQIRTAAGEVRWLHHICRSVYDEQGAFLGRRASNYDITEEINAKQQKDELLSKLQEAAEKVSLLSGFLPICANCKKIRDDSGYWNQIESYIAKHTEAVFSHSICPNCAKKLYPDIYPAMYPPPKQDPDQK